MLNLEKKMTLVVHMITQSYKAKKVLDVENEDSWHHDLFHETATILELYDPKTNLAPIWLSRIVSGIMRDVDDELG